MLSARSIFFRSHKIAILALLLIVTVSVNVGAQEKSTNSDEESVRTVIGYYFQGHATGDGSYMRRAFLPTARIEGLPDGKVSSRTLDEFCALFTGKVAADESKRKRTIDSIDITGTAATARVTLDYGKIVFTDYFVLLKVDGEWKISNKIYNLKRNN